MTRLLIITSLALALAACDSQSSSPAAAPAQPATPAAQTKPAPPPAATVSSTAPTAASAATSAVTAAVPAATSSSAAVGATAAASVAPANGLSATAKAMMAQAARDFVDTGQWVAGKNYAVIDPVQRKLTDSPKVEVIEVFNFGCPACNMAHSAVDAMKAALPPYATMDYLSAGFRPDENWTLYQRTWYAAKALGLADPSYDAMFDANWKTGETGSYNLATGRLKARDQWPDIHTVAQFFSRQFGVEPETFVAVANSFAVNTAMKRADEMVKAYQVPATPTIVVNGRYRFTFQKAGSYDQGIELAKWLVAKEAKRLQAEPTLGN